MQLFRREEPRTGSAKLVFRNPEKESVWKEISDPDSPAESRRSNKRRNPLSTL
jgi:hypothetical protein